ncbi:helix-turn-helix transcriptional regulator [Planctomycetota bacterium]
MEDDLLSTSEAARRLGLSRSTLYEWVARSNAGTLRLRGQPVAIDHFRTGAKGQGPIQFEAKEIQRLRELMRVRPHALHQRRPPKQRRHFPGIYVELGDVSD